ncbi:PREDICTED: protein FAM71F2-like [Thamnophis sirtalis]|uniref:Protein FAM71F2-like n=1 Tax=Thamnophis sirtalis TaxID=35019 RepID=A0A6I9Z354_9SAUR|nr:PREDICTED: protein FAM71F2-like [Thamnophis sirtalis]
MASGLFTGSNPDAGRALGLEGGLLCQLIRSPDYNLFPNSAVFESNFIQVTKKGKWIGITHTPTIVTLAVTSSDPCLPLPNVLLMANQRAPPQRVHAGSPQLSQMDLTRPTPGALAHLPAPPAPPLLELTASLALPRLLPLRYVRLSVHNASQRILRLQTVTKTVYYLQLHQDHPEAVFGLWSRLSNILQNGLSTTTKDPAIPIHHCLVSSRSSSVSSIGPLVEPQRSDTVVRSTGVTKRVSRKVSGSPTHFPPSLKQIQEKPRRVSFQTQQQTLEDTSGVSSDIKVLYYDLPPPLVCARCKGRLPRSEPRKCRLHARPADSDVELAPWMDRRTHGLWQQETPTWLQPLCRLSSLAAAGWK